MAILENEVYVGVSKKNRDYYINKGYDVPLYSNRDKQMVVKRGTKIKVKISDLKYNNAEKVTKICDLCGSISIVPYCTIIDSRKNGDGIDRCLDCSRFMISKTLRSKLKPENSMEVKYKEKGLEWVLNEFDRDKNIDSPENISRCANYSVWWKCSKCFSSFSASPKHRWHGTGCPYCSKQKVNHTNCLFACNKELSEEWNSEMNGNLTPKNTAPYSNKKVWWTCSKCSCDYEATVTNRSSGRSCPECSKLSKMSKGERKIFDFLKYGGFDFSFQYFFSDCKLKYRLIFDFAVFNDDDIVLIEYDGEQHFKPTQFGGTTKEKALKNFELCKKRDRVKNNYCKTKGIELVRIPYTDFDMIEDILHKQFLK